MIRDFVVQAWNKVVESGRPFNYLTLQVIRQEAYAALVAARKEHVLPADFRLVDNWIDYYAGEQMPNWPKAEYPEYYTGHIPDEVLQNHPGEPLTPELIKQMEEEAVLLNGFSLPVVAMPHNGACICPRCIHPTPTCITSPLSVKFTAYVKCQKCDNKATHSESGDFLCDYCYINS